MSLVLRLKLLCSLDFVKLHEFLLAPLLRAAMADTFKGCECCATKEKKKRVPKRVVDVHMWLLCFHCYAAAAASFTWQMLASSILQV